MRFWPSFFAGYLKLTLYLQHPCISMDLGHNKGQKRAKCRGHIDSRPYVKKHCQTNLIHKMSQISEQRFLHNLRSLNPFLKSEMPKNGQFFHKSHAKCARSEFLSIFGASAQLHGGTHIFYFTANPSLGILFQRWEVEKPFKKTFSPYFGLKFTIRHIPVIIENHDISKL